MIVGASSSAEVRPGPWPFSARGLKLGLFWLLAAACFVSGWWWRPLSASAPSPAPAPALAQPGAAPAVPEAGGFMQKLREWDDSWEAMRTAIEVLRDQPGRPLYAAVFERHFKFQYPPSSLLGLEAAQALFGAGATSNLVLNLLGLLLMPVLLLSCYALCRPALPALRAAPLDHLLPILFALCCYPALKAIQLGQIQTYLNALFCLSTLLYVRGKSTAAGLIVGVMATIKPQMGVFLLWSLVQRDYVFARSMGASAAAIFLVSLARYGLAHHLEYLAVLSEISRHGESYYANQSLNGLLLRALHLGPNLQFSFADFAPYTPWVRYPTLISTLLLMLVALWRLPGSGIDRGLDFVLAALCFTIGSPIAWEHHYGIVPAIFAVCFVALVRTEAPPAHWGALALAWLLIATRIGAVAALADTPLNFLQSYTYFGGLILLAVVYLARLRSRAH